MRCNGTTANIGHKSDIAPLGQLALTASTSPIATSTKIKGFSTKNSKQGMGKGGLCLGFKRFQYSLRKDMSHMLCSVSVLDIVLKPD